MQTDLEKECDKLWGQAVLVRAGFRSEISGATAADIIDPHHLVSRSYQRTRYDLRAGLAVTRVEHENPAQIEAWLRENRPRQYAFVRKAKQDRACGRSAQKPDLVRIKNRLERFVFG